MKRPAPSLTEVERFEVYVEPLQNFLENLSPSEFLKRGSALELQEPDTLLIDQGMKVASLFRQVMKLDSMEGLGLFSKPRIATAMTYTSPVILGLLAEDIQGSVFVRFGDSTRPSAVPTLSKARRILDPGASALAPLDHYRHFASVESAINSDVEWKTKNSTLVWRGMPTGPKPGLAHRKEQSREWIIDLYRRNKGSKIIDVGFTATARLSPQLSENWRGSVKAPLTMEEQLKSKYLLSLEGNDVASGLKWMLSSNSVVLMPEPSIESWFCESLLRPWVHYIPVSPDLSDVEDRVDWCKSNDAEAESIAKRGSRFAHSFLNPETEASLFRRVVKWYSKQEKIQELVEQYSVGP